MSKKGGRIPSSRQFNLLREGTGIRFAPLEHEQPKKPVFPLRGALLLLLLVVAMGGYLLVSSTAPQPAAPVAPPVQQLAPPPAPAIMREETVTANAAPVEEATPVPDAAPVAAPPPPSFHIRFGLFLSRENAEQHLRALSLKGIAAEVRAATRPMPAWTITAGPARDAAEWKQLLASKNNLAVAPVAEVDGKYLVIGPIWLKDQALAAEKKLRAAKVKVEMAEERKDRAVFKVLSFAYDTIDAAREALAETKKSGIEGVIDE